MVFRQDNFTEQAQQVLQNSQEMVGRYKHSQWDVEHILMALLGLDDGLPTQILEELGVSTGHVKERLDLSLEAVPKVVHEAAQIYATPRATRVLENAKFESERLKDDFIGAEHLFIAAIMETQGDSAQILKDFGVDQEKVYKAKMMFRGAPRVADPQAKRRYRAMGKYSNAMTT